MKYRIVKLPEYTTLYQLEKQGFWGWTKVRIGDFYGWGTIEQCKEVIATIKKYGKDLTVHEEEV